MQQQFGMRSGTTVGGGGRWFREQVTGDGQMLQPAHVLV